MRRIWRNEWRPPPHVGVVLTRIAGELGKKAGVGGAVERQSHRAFGEARENDGVGDLERHEPALAVARRSSAAANRLIKIAVNRLMPRSRRRSQLDDLGALARRA